LRQAKDKGSDAAARAKQDAHLGAERARAEASQHTSGTTAQSASTEPATDWRNGTTAAQPTSASDPEATQHMPPPASPNR
jgi:hypothetical protein